LISILFFILDQRGVGQPHHTLGSHYSTLEEARADLFALYYILDPKLVELGVIPSVDVGKAEYNSYFGNGLLSQLVRIKLGNDVEEAHMRNRKLICEWVLERGEKSGCVKRFKHENKTFVKIFDFALTRSLVGELLREVQRIKSQGDGVAGARLVEQYGVKVRKRLCFFFVVGA
jgi:dipeptidyl-peptidase III